MTPHEPSRMAKLAMRLAFAGSVAAAVAGVALVQQRQDATPASAGALLAAAADVQHESARLPNTFAPLTDAEEVERGNRIAQSMRDDGTDAPRAAAVEAYLQTVGMRVATHARRKLPWHFHYLGSPALVNAFALPGGHIYVGEGLLRLVDSEDALAAVLGHEIEHVDLRHCAEREQTNRRLQQLGPLGSVAALPVQLFVAGYSKEEEREADRDGTTLAVRADYSYTGALALFQRFAQIEAGGQPTASRAANPVSEATHLSAETLAGYLQSHPPSRQRAAFLQQQATDRAWNAHALRPLPQRLR